MRTCSPRATPGVFYDRHVRAPLGYFVRRTGDPEVAANLTAETIAGAIAAQCRYKPASSPAIAWLFTIASRRLVDYHRRGSAEQRMRRSLAMQRPPLGDDDVAMIRMLAEDTVGALLAELPSDQRDAVVEHVVEDRGYREIADARQTSQVVGASASPAAW